MLDLRDLDLPVVAAPMAGGPSTPALVAAVSGAGGLGMLAAGYRSADAMAHLLAEARTTTAPVGVNLFVVEPFEPDAEELAAYRHAVEPEASRLGVSLGEPRWDDDRWRAKLDLVHDLRPDLVSFTFGCPAADVLRSLAGVGVLTSVTVTSVAEARAALARGAATLTVQGPEAGGHRGAWDPVALPDPTPLGDLLGAVAAAVDVPLVAAGGLHDAAGVRAVLARGAVAAQAGTAYLLAVEAGTHPTHRAALADPDLGGTAVTRAFTGRWARGLRNRFVDEHTDAPAGYPHLHHLTSPLRQTALAHGDTAAAHLWAGTAHVHARTATAAEITRWLAP